MCLTCSFAEVIQASVNSAFLRKTNQATLRLGSTRQVNQETWYSNQQVVAIIK